jgi:NADPH-dependent F420 reductase
MRIGILGATGPAGRGLAARLASVGHEVAFGSRERAKAEEGVHDLHDEWGEARLRALRPSDNAEACDAPVVILAVNADAAIATAKTHAARLAGRIVVSMANNLVRNGREFNAVLPPHGSIAAEMQALLWDSKVVTAFHLVPAAEFGELDHEMESDVVVLGDDDDARATLMDITRSIPRLRPLDGGSLHNAVGMETFAAVLLTINIRHKGRASLRLTGV